MKFNFSRKFANFLFQVFVSVFFKMSVKKRKWAKEDPADKICMMCFFVKNYYSFADQIFMIFSCMMSLFVSCWSTVLFVVCFNVFVYIQD